jgi:hypothetical protein
MDVFQRDGLGRHRNRPGASIAADVIKLVVQRDQIRINICDGCPVRFAYCRFELAVYFGQCSSQAMYRPAQITLEPLEGKVPTLPPRNTHFAKNVITLLPGRRWQLSGSRYVSVGFQLIMNRDGET